MKREKKSETEAEALQIVLDLSKQLYLAESYEEIGRILFDNLSIIGNRENPAGKLLVYDSETDELRTAVKLESVHNAPMPDVLPFKDIKYFSKLAIEKKETIFIPDNHSDYSLSIDPRHKLNPACSLVFIPLYYDKDFLGIFSYASQPGNSIDPGFIAMLETICKTLSIIIRQIQNREKAQKSILLTETLSRELINATNEYAILLDTEGFFLYANEKTARTFEGIPAYKSGTKLWDLIPPNLRKAQQTTFNKVKESMQPLTIEIEYGGMWFSERIYPIKDDNGNLIRIAIYAADITEQKNAYQKLIESKRELSTFFSNLPGIAYRCRNDKDWTMEFMTERCIDITGYLSEEILYNRDLSFGDIIHPNDREHVWSEVQYHLSKKENYDLNYRIITKQNRVKWVLESAVGIFNTGGELQFIEGILFDITRRKRSEILKEILYELSDLASSGSDMEDFLLFMYKKINEIINAKNCFVAIYNQQSDALVFPLYKDEFSDSPRRRDFKRGKTEYILKTGKPFIATREIMSELIEKGVMGVDNTKYKSWLGVPLKVKDRTFGVLAIRNYDIENCFTEDDVELITPIANYIALTIDKKRSEQEKSILDLRFRSIWEKSSDGLRLLDNDGMIVLVNEAFCKMAELKMEELIGKPFSFVYSEESRSLLLEKFRDNLSSGKIIRSYERKITLWNGKALWVEVSNSIIEFEDTPKMVMSIMSDVTKRKVLEEQLIQSQKMESIGRLAGGVAHDFNNILTVVQGNSEMIKRIATGNSKLSGFADKIILAAKRGSDLSKQLLSFAKLNRQIINAADLNELVSESLKLLEHIIGKNIEIKTFLDPAIKTIDADFGNIQQVIMNLCINARDAISGNGMITITTGSKVLDKASIEKPSELQDGDYVFLSIADNGSGIPDEIKPHIFEPFFTTKDNSRGTGLGLAIVYGIIRSHNGFIVTDSVYQKGTTFTIYFPVSKQTYLNQLKNPRSELILGNFENILLVDDEELILEIGKEILSSLNYYPISAGSGLKGLELYEQLQDQLATIIIDQIMPDKSGSEIAKIIKSKNPQANIILSSGTSDQLIEELLTNKVISGFIQKPYKIEELSILLNRIISNKKQD